MAEIRRNCAGTPYLYIQLIEDSMFAAKVHGMTLHIPETNHVVWAKWEEAIANESFPQSNGLEALVENLPKFYTLNDDGMEVCRLPRTSMVVFVLCDRDGNPYEDPRTKALKLIEKHCATVVMEIDMKDTDMAE